jgi:hypothetical protein
MSKIIQQVVAIQVPCSAEVKQFSTVKQRDLWFRLHSKKCVECMCANKDHVTHDFRQLDRPKTTEIKGRLNVDASCRNILNYLDISGVTA